MEYTIIVYTRNRNRTYDLKEKRIVVLFVAIDGKI